MSIMAPEPVASCAPPRRGTLRLRATDVTGSLLAETDDILRGTPAGAVAQVFADRMELPANVPWALRDDRTGQYLDDQKPIDEQISDTEARLTLTPKTHLG